MFIACFMSLIFLLTLTCGSAATYPATVEFDVVFPRNDTYAPAELMPVVFAIQNPQAAVPLTLGIEWSLQRLGSSGGPLAGSFVDLAWANFSTDPYFVVLSTNQLNATEGSFGLLWVLHSGNCSGNLPGATQLGSSIGYNNIKFTTKNGAQQPSLMTGPDMCPIENLTFNVTGTLPVADPIQYSDRNVCAVVSEPPPPANPCAVKVNDSIASSISVAITASACSTPHPILTSGCPVPANKTSLAVRSKFREMGLTGVAMGSWLSLLFLGLQ
jgi:hypothetical protein